VRKQLQPGPSLILIMGVAGSGKTTLAKEILRRLWAVYLDNNHLADGFFPETRSGKAYEQFRPHVYRALYAIAEANLKVGNTVLLDVPHVKEMQDARWRRFISSLAARAKAKLIVIRCFCSEKTLQARLRSRGEKRDRWKLAHWKEFLAQQPIQLSLPLPHLDIDTEKNSAANLRAVTRYILEQSA
jgi:predicted kinase